MIRDNFKPLVVFAYNFPHKKTQDILLRLFCLGFPVGLVISSDPKPLNIPPPLVRTKISHIGVMEPRIIAERIGAQYVVAPHNSSFVSDMLTEFKPDLGVIAGARILRSRVIEKFRVGILNLHPGLIPEARGLDAMLWSIYQGIPLGVTAHLIDEHIDAGRIVLRERINVYPDDSLLDISERLHDKQLEVLGKAVLKALNGEWVALESDKLTPPNSKMPPELEIEAVRRFEDYKKRFAGGGGMLGE